MSQVFVLDTTHQPRDPIHPGRARILLRTGQAAVFKRFPFTIILHQAVDQAPAPLRVKIDPGSRTTGIAVVNDATGTVVFAAELQHRGTLIKQRLDERRAVRRNRRSRKLRHRAPRFDNRRRKAGWLPPSLESRVVNITTWINRLCRIAPIQEISMELVKFDTQQMQNAEISGVEYQQGELAGYEVREYLLEKWGRQCAYCGKRDTPLEVEHIVPKSRGGTNRVSNLTLACHACNQRKGDHTAAEWGHPAIQQQARQPLGDAAAVNATRWALYQRLAATGRPVETGSGGLTKYNRAQRGLPKTHWLDAACVGTSTPVVLNRRGVRVLAIKARGHGNRQMCRTDKYGFPRLHRTRCNVYFGFRTGDLGRAVIITGKNRGTHTGRIAVRAVGRFRLGTVDGISHKQIRKLWAVDGYDYAVLNP